MADDLTRKPLDTWSAEDVKTAAAAGLPPTYARARAMLEDHDYFQGGKLWVGQRADAGLSAEQLRRIEPVFVPDPLLEEIRENRTNGLLQREPSVAFDPVKPAADQQTEDERVTAVVSAIARWWDRTKFWSKARDAFGRTSYARRSALRVFIPEANLTDGTTTDGATTTTLPTAKTLEEALERIEIEAPLPDTAGRFTLATQREVAVVVTGDELHRVSELWSVETDAVGARTTLVRVLAGSAQAQTVPYDLGGRLPVVEMKTAELVTEPVIRQQSLLNFASTVLNRVLETAGFPERYLANVDPPGIWLSFPPEGEPPLATDKDSNGATIYKHRRPWVFGFSTVAELVGLRTTEPTPSGVQREVFATPSVTRFDPVNPDYIKTASELIRNRLYHLCRQGHLAADSTAQLSGLAYQQARAGFEADLLTQKGGLEGMVRDAIEVVLAYAGLMHAETKTFLEDFRCVVTLHVTSGPVTPDEARLASELRTSGLVSLATAMGRVGVEDIGAEQAAIEADPLATADRWGKIAAAIQALNLATGGIVTPDGAAFLLGLTPEQIEVFRTGTAPAPNAVPAKPTLTAA